MRDNTGIRLLKDRVFKSIIIIFSFAVIIPLGLILFGIVKNGISAINWDLFTKLPTPPGEAGGGILNSIVGSLILILIAVLLSVPFGIMLGIFLSENKGRFADVLSILVNTLQGVPSIVIGIVAYLWVVKPLGGFSALSGGIALGIMMLPIVIKSTEETLKLIPFSLKESALGLGASYVRTMFKVVLPAGFSGILSGILLGIARIAGETAPLLFTAFGNPYLNLNIFKPVDSLPLVIFNYSMSPYDDWHRIAWGASFVLVLIVLGLNVIARLKIWRNMS